jgi:Peptidase family M28/Fibronectin type III domain
VSRFRSLAFTMATAAVTAAATVAVVGSPATGHPGGGDRPPDWWRPPRDVRGMLDEVSAKSLERYDRALVGFGTRHTLSTQDDPNRGIGAARDWIKAELEKSAATSNGRMTVALDSYVQPAGTSRIDVDTTITNVYATLKGTDPTSADRVYVIGGHYDSRVTDVMNRTSDAPGANDDASGVSAVLELARVMASRPTASTIVFVAYAGEEQNLYGSNHLAQFAQDHGWNVQGVLNMDIIGSSLGGNGVSEPHLIRLFSEGIPTAVTQPQISRLQSLGGENDSASRQLARYVKETGENGATDMEVKLVWRRDRFLRGGDQISWQQRGWPGVRFTEPNENFDHQHQDVRVENGKQFGDLPEFVDFRYLARVTRVIGSALTALERSPRAPANARVISANLSYDAELRWNPNPESDVAGYEIVWRDSTEPLWTHAKFVGNVTDATIQNLNKDDNQVGVRAVDREGNRSPVAFPVPATS